MILVSGAFKMGVTKIGNSTNIMGLASPMSNAVLNPDVPIKLKYKTYKSQTYYRPSQEREPKQKANVEKVEKDILSWAKAQPKKPSFKYSTAVFSHLCK